MKAARDKTKNMFDAGLVLWIIETDLQRLWHQMVSFGLIYFGFIAKEHKVLLGCRIYSWVVLIRFLRRMVSFLFFKHGPVVFEHPKVVGLAGKHMRMTQSIGIYG